MNPSTFGARLRAAREASGLTQEKLAHETNVTTSSVSKYERDELTNPTVESVIALANRLDVSLDWLLRGVGRGPSVSSGAAA
jgi:transcriptional regulator with XRE-family HTH domain